MRPAAAREFGTVEGISPLSPFSKNYDREHSQRVREIGARIYLAPKELQLVILAAVEVMLGDPPRRV